MNLILALVVPANPANQPHHRPINAATLAVLTPARTSHSGRRAVYTPTPSTTSNPRAERLTRTYTGATTPLTGDAILVAIGPDGAPADAPVTLVAAALART